MANHYESALSKVSSASHIFETHTETPYVEVNSQHFKESQFHNQNTVDQVVVVNPATSVPSNVFDAGGAFVDVFLDDDSKIHKLREIYLEFDLTNDDALALTPGVTDFMLERYETFLGEKSLGTTHAISNYLSEKAFLNYDETICVQDDYNIDPLTYDESTTTMAAAETKKFRINITGPLRGTGIFVPGVGNQKIKITIYFNNVANWAVSANPVVSATNFRVLVEHTKLNKKNYDSEMTMYKQLGIRLRYLDPRYTKHAHSDVAGTENSQRISNLSGLSAMYFVVLRNQNPTGANLTVFNSIEDMYVSDGSSNIVGGSTLKGAHLKFQSHKKLPSRLCYLKDVYFLPWCESPLSTITNGVQTGYLSTSENNVFYWSATATNNNQLEIVSLTYSSMYIKGGTCIIEKTL